TFLLGWLRTHATSYRISSSSVNVMDHHLEDHDILRPGFLSYSLRDNVTSSDHYVDTASDMGALRFRPLPLRQRDCLEEDKGANHHILAARRVDRRGGVKAGSMERPARDRTVGDRVVALEHRDLGRLLLGKPVPLVVGTIG